MTRPTADPGLPRRRLRATFLLRAVLLAGSLALVAAAFALGAGTGWTFAAGASAIVLWFLGVELGLLAWTCGRAAARRARRDEPLHSIWFVDVDHERRRDRAALHDDTRDNPTLR